MQSKVEKTDAEDAVKLSAGSEPETRLTLDWLKIIENATAGLNADLEAARREKAFPPLKPEMSPKEPARPAARPFASVAAQPVLHAPAFAEEPKAKAPWGGKLAKLAYSFFEPQSAPPQTLWAALMPYAVAAGVFVFISGGALAFFTLGSSPADVDAAGETTRAQTLVSPVAREEPRPAARGEFKAPVAKAAASAPVSLGAMTDPRESAQKPRAEPAPTWSETVETFRQFVKAEVQKSAARSGKPH
jgi:hypothetical protein